MRLRAARMGAAKLLGIVVSEASASDVADLLQQQEKTFQAVKGTIKDAPKRYEERCGALSATGFVLAQCSTGTALWARARRRGPA